MLCLAVCAEACLVTPVLTVFPNRYNYLAQFRAASVNTPIPTSSPNAPVLSSNERHPFQDLMESNSWTLSEDAFGSDGALRSLAAEGMKESAPHKGLPAQRGPPPPSLRKTYLESHSGSAQKKSKCRFLLCLEESGSRRLEQDSGCCKIS